MEHLTGSIPSDQPQAQLRGATWINVFSPQVQNYDVTVAPAAPGAGTATGVPTGNSTATDQANAPGAAPTDTQNPAAAQAGSNSQQMNSGTAANPPITDNTSNSTAQSGTTMGSGGTASQGSTAQSTDQTTGSTAGSTAGAAGSDAAAPAVGSSTTSVPTTTDMTAQLNNSDNWIASKLIGKSVRNKANETIGNVNDIVIGKDGKVVALVLGVGGFLGLGERSVAVPMDKLQIAASGTTTSDGSTVSAGTLMMDETKDTLNALPEYKPVAAQPAQ